MEEINVGIAPNDGTGDTLREAGIKMNSNTDYLQALISASKMNNGLNREDTTTIGILQYCHSASAGIVDNIDEDGVYSELSGQSFFADGTTALADRTFAIYHSPTETQFSYWALGQLIEVTTIKTIQMPDVAGKYYLAFEDDGDLHIQTDMQAAIVSNQLAGLIYHNPVDTESNYVADERHGTVMSGQTHLNIHMQRGFGWVQGLDMSGLVNNGSTFAGVSSGRCGDEDIPMFYEAITDCPFIYRNGVNGDWEVSAVSDNNLGLKVAGDVVYNENTTGDTYTLTPIGLDYVVMHFLATNNKKHPIVKLIGQTLYATRDLAQVHLPSAFNEIEMNGLPSSETVPIASMIIHVESVGQIELGADTEVYYDCRKGFPIARF